MAPAVVSIEGLIVGDDYAAKGAALLAAMEMPGPSTLVHPWLGPMTVILEEPGQVFFSDRELRVTRFSLQVKRLPVGGLGGLARLGGSLAALTAAVTSTGAAIGRLANAQERRTLSAARQRSVNRATRIFHSAASRLAPAAGARRSLPRLLAAIPATAPTGAGAFDAMVSAAVAVLAMPPLVPAVSPAAGAVIEAAPQPLALMTLAVDLATTLSAEIAEAPSAPDAALMAAACTRALAAAAGQSIYASYESRREALAFRGRAVAAIGDAAAALETMSASAFAGEAGDLRRELAALQAAIAADINERIGRLPDVLVLRPDMPVEAWQVAHHLFGDDPAAVEPAFRDIVRRNRPRHPAHMDGPVEVLK